MRKILKKIIPGKLVTAIRAFINGLRIFTYYPRDIRRYLKYSSTLIQNKNLSNLEAKVTADAHIIEKGLSLKNPRLGFGKGVIDRLLDWLDLYRERNYPAGTFAQKFAVSVLHTYHEFNRKNNFDVSEFEDRINKHSQAGIENFGGSRFFVKKNVLENVKKEFPELVKNRFSLRQFSDEPVDRELLNKAFELAKYSPTVCNRQSSKIYVIESEAIKAKVLELQKGTRGFTEQIDKALIITSDIGSFFGLQERNQPYVDGGAFCMNLMFSMSYYGIGSCPLNWCAEYKRDDQLKKLLGIPDSENVIMVIGIGNMPDEFKVAKSPRKDSKTLIKYI